MILSSVCLLLTVTTQKANTCSPKNTPEQLPLKEIEESPFLVFQFTFLFPRFSNGIIFLKTRSSVLCSICSELSLGCSRWFWVVLGCSSLFWRVTGYSGSFCFYELRLYRMFNLQIDQQKWTSYFHFYHKVEQELLQSGAALIHYKVGQVLLKGRGEFLYSKSGKVV